jgi:hypothetical protein
MKLVAMSSLSLLIQSCIPVRVTEANRFLRSFPEKLDREPKVIKCEVEGAQHCLVHILQSHYADPDKMEESLLSDGVEPDNVLEEMLKTYQSINRVQRDIYHIIRDLLKRGIINEVYTEGLCEKDRNHETWRDIYVVDRCNLARIGLVGGEKQDGSADPRAKLYMGDYYMRLFFLYPRSGNFEIESNEENVVYIPGADKLLSLEKRLHFKPGESEELNRLANSAVYADHFAYLQKRREDYVLQLIANSEMPYSFVIYGGAHNFFDNIDVWNGKNSDNKLSLITITPTDI